MRKKLCKNIVSLNAAEKIMLAISLAFFVGITWVNFFGRQWYSMDMYADAYVAKLMAQGNTLFPDGWIFGNQYYGFATPTLAALIYKICPDSFYAVAIASTLMTVLIIAAIVWCLRPFCSAKSIFVCVFVMLCLVPGNSAAECYQGMQIFYTMASYYACYLIGILVTLGVYLRLRFGQTTRKALFMCAAAIAVNFLLGINSPRELLVLNLPLLAIEFFYAAAGLFKKQKILRKPLAFSAAALLAECAGLLTLKLANVNTHRIIAQELPLHGIKKLVFRLKMTFNAFVEITGLKLFTEDKKLLPISVMGAVCVCIVIAAIIIIIKKRDSSVAAVCIAYCCVSLAAVAAVGLFIMSVRHIYFFVWFLLCAFSAAYLYENINRNGGDKSNPKKHNRRAVIAASLLCLMALANFTANFLPCVKGFAEKEEMYKSMIKTAEADGVGAFWVFETTTPTVAMYSHDKITAGTVKINEAWINGESEKPLAPLEFLSHRQMYDSDSEYVYLIISWRDRTYYFSRFEDGIMQRLSEQAEVAGEYRCRDNDFTLYKIPKKLLDFDLFENR